MKNIQNLANLKIVGMNQLQKEIKELKDISDKKIDELGLHRNEETLEIEGVTESQIELKKLRKKEKKESTNSPQKGLENMDSKLSLLTSFISKKSNTNIYN